MVLELLRVDLKEIKMTTLTITMLGAVQAATPGAIGFDCDTVLNANTAQAFVTAGFNFVVRYLSLASSQQYGDLNETEAAAILQAGLALMAVQHVMYEGWVPTQALGQQSGQNAANNAQSIGLPAGVAVWLDLEGINGSTSAIDVVNYCNAWFGAVSTAGYVPGIYVGANCILNGDQLYYDLTVAQYWKSGSNVPTVTTRGFCMVQTISDSYNLAGVSYDQNVVQADNMGNTPNWLTLSQQQPAATS
jgi:hypothetical protein